jgi:hypothetical protein
MEIRNIDDAKELVRAWHGQPHARGTLRVAVQGLELALALDDCPKQREVVEYLRAELAKLAEER